MIEVRVFTRPELSILTYLLILLLLKYNTVNKYKIYCGDFFLGGFCPRGDFVQGDFVRGILSRGVRGDFVLILRRCQMEIHFFSLKTTRSSLSEQLGFGGKSEFRFQLEVFLK